MTIKAIRTLFILTALIFGSTAYAAVTTPANDDFANAEEISGMQVHIARTNAQATKEAGEPNIAGNFGGKSIWFKWTAPSSRRMMITLRRSSFDTLLGVYTGSSLGNLQLVAENNNIAGGWAFNSRSFVTFKPTAGTTYYIAVDGVSGLATQAAFGEVVLDIAPVASRTSGDYDADGTTDIGVFRGSAGTWWVVRSSNPFFFTNRQWGLAGDWVVSADLDEVPDGRTDFVVFRPSEGMWYIMQNRESVFHDVHYFRFGMEGDYPVTGDFLGNERTDIGVYRPSEGTFYLSELNGNYIVRPFGVQGDLPVVGDYDMDDRTDLAIFRPSTGMWYIERSTGGHLEVPFGMPGDVPMRGDYDGDGIFDLTVWRPTTGEWYTLRSSDGQVQIVRWGMNGDIPERGDFDGDGKQDYAVFRWSDATWYVLKSSDVQLLAVQFGQALDQSATSVF